MPDPAEPSPSPSPPPDVLAAIERRRTARRFDPARPLADDTARRLLELAALAPLPYPLQPARFVLVRAERNRRRLRLCTFGDARLTEAPAAVLVLGYLDPPRTDLEPFLADQLARGVIAPDDARRLRATVPRAWRDLGDPTLAATRAGMMAAATLIHAATGLGLASAWVEAFDREKVRASFGVPDDHAVVALVALGHPAGPPPPSPGRLPLDRVTYVEHFGQPWPLLDPEHDSPR